MNKRLSIMLFIVAVLNTGTVQAADLYSSGAKTWDTNTANWGVSGGPYNTATWSNATPDSAFFEGSAGTVTLGEAITVQNIRFTAAVNYTIQGNILNFGSGGTITNAVIANQTIKCGISGSPSVGIMDNSSAIITFAPTTSSQTLGICTVPYEAGSSDKATLILDGTTTGNSVSKITYQSIPDNHWGSFIKQGSGTWTVGNVDIGTVTITAGNLVVNGTIHTYYGGTTLSGGTFHYNNPGAVTANQGFTLNGGSLDNSSGAAITTSTYNPGMAWNGDFTFIGSLGANSDLNLGTGAVTLNNNNLTGNPNVTIQNGATTLTVGGAIGGAGIGQTKLGLGTLKLSGVNTYSGPTFPAAGTLKLSNNSALQNSALVTTGAGFITLDTGITTPTIGGLSGATGDLATIISSGYGSVTTLTLNPGAGITVTYGGVIADGAANMNVIKTGAGTQILSGNNTYGGTTTISAGKLVASTPGSLPNYGITGKVVFNGGTLITPVGGSGWTPAQVDTMLANATQTSGALGLDITSGTQTQSGAYGGALGLTKEGMGTLELNLANTYTGTTTVNGGTLLLDGANGAIASSSGITVGQTTGVTGTLTLDSSANNNSDRIGSVGISFNNGTFNLIGNASAATTETIGTITAAVGHNQIVLSGGAPGQVATLTSTAGAVTRTAGATLNIIANGTSQQFKFTGGSAGINKGVFYGTTASEFAYYPGSGAAVRAPNYGSDTDFQTAAATLTASKHNKLSGDDGSQDAISIYSLNMPNNYSVTMNGDLTFTSATDQGAIIKSGGGAAQISGAYDIAGVNSGELVINTVDAGDNLTLNIGVTATTTALTKTGAGTLTLTANRDYLYTGATYVNAGTLVVNALNTDCFKSSITINSGGTFKLSAANKIVNTATIGVNAGGTFDLAGFSDTISSLAGSGSVVNTGGAATLTLNAATTFPGIISGNTALTLGAVNGSAPIFILSGTNTYTGLTLLSGANLKLGATDAIKAGNAVTVQAQNGVTVQSIDLAGYDQTVGTLTLGGGWGNGNTYVMNSIGSSKLTLTGGLTTVAEQGVKIYVSVTTLDLNNATQTFTIPANVATEITVSSVIQNGGITKTGTGTMLLSGANTYAGGTMISGGTLQVGGTSGTLGTGWVTNNASLVFNRGDTLTVSNTISGTGTLKQNGSGATSLAATNTYTGTTTVSAGALLVNGSVAAGSTVTVNSGGTLGGTGTVNGAVTVQAGGTIAPGASTGNSLGVLICASNVTIAGTLSIDISDSQTPKSDKLAVSGNLDITGATLNTVISGKAVQPSYVIASYKTLTGTFGVTNGLPADWKINTNYKNANQIALITTSVPGLIITIR